MKDLLWEVNDNINYNIQVACDEKVNNGNTCDAEDDIAILSPITHFDYIHRRFENEQVHSVKLNTPSKYCGETFEINAESGKYLLIYKDGTYNLTFLDENK